jgi:uncharacterized membrane protein YhaH (DUF805 family)
MKYYISVLRNYAQFSGRARRKEYWMFALFNLIFIIIARILDEILKISFNANDLFLHYGFFYALYSLFIFVPNLSVTARRLHDIGKSGWYMLICYIPLALTTFFVLILKNALAFVLPVIFLAVAIWLLVLLCKNGDPHENAYGQDPKGTGNDQFDFMNNTYSTDNPVKF